MIKVGNQSDLKKKKLPISNSKTSDLYNPTATKKVNFSRTDLKKTQYWMEKKKKKKKNRKTGCNFQICRTFSFANSKFANLMIKVGNQSDLKKKRLPTLNSETSDLCKPTTTTTKVNFSRMDLKKTQHWKKKKKKPDAVSKFVEPFLLQIVAPLLFVFWWGFFFPEELTKSNLDSVERWCAAGNLIGALQNWPKKNQKMHYLCTVQQASSTWRMMMYLSREMDGGPFLVYFLPILGGQKPAVLDSVEGWLPGRGMVCSRQPGSFRVLIRMDHRMDGQRRDDGTDDETRGFRGGFISHPNVL